MSSRAIVLYMHVHQPYRVRPYSVFDSAVNHDYFADIAPQSTAGNQIILRKVAEKSYMPTIQLLKQLIHDNPDFCLSLSITGTVIEQLRDWAPETLREFQQLVATGKVEIIGETYHHSLAFFYSRFEFEKQVRMHADLIESTFGVRPSAFRNTELAYNDEIGAWAEAKGYKAVLAEGWDRTLYWRSPNYAYKPRGGNGSTALLLKNYRLSDDIAFRFGNDAWEQWPLTADKYVGWLNSIDKREPLINLFMDFETFGEHQWEDKGIFSFLKELPGQFISSRSGNTFMTVTQAATHTLMQDEISMPTTVTWADSERDLSAWLGNSMQQDAMRYLYELEDDVLAVKDDLITADWRRLQTSDHAYYMCTKWFRDGDVHAYFSPYDSPYDAFLYYMNVLRDLRLRIDEALRSKTEHSTATQHKAKTHNEEEE